MEVMSAGTVGNILMSGGSGIPQWVSTSSFIVDSDFASNGLMVRTGSGIYTSTSTLSLGSGGTGNNNWADLSIPYVSGSAMAGIAIGTPDYVLAVNGSGTGYTWVSASSTGAWRDDESIMDVAGGLIASTSGTRTLITITYQDGTDDIDFVVNSDLSQYNNSTSQFYSTTTGMILPLAYGGTGTSTFQANSLLFASDNNVISEILAGNDGLVLKMVGGTPTWSSDLTSGGGEGLWSTSTNDLAIYPSTNRAVVIGGMGTTNSGYLFEVTSGNALFDGITAESLALTNSLSTLYGGLGANVTTTGAGALLYSTSASAYGALATGTIGNILMSQGAGAPVWVSTSTYVMDNEFGGTGLMVRTGTNAYAATSTLSLGSGGTGASNWANLNIPYVSNGAMAGIAIGTPDYVLAVNGSGTGYTWVSASSTGAWRDDESIMDVAGGLIASTSGTRTLITITYQDGTDDIDFVVNSDLSQYNNSTSQFYSTTTGMILPLAYGGTHKNMTGAAGGVGYNAADSMEVMSAGTVGNILMSGGSG